MESYSLNHQFNRKRIVYVTQKEFKGIVGKQHIKLSTCCCNPFQVGEPVVLQVYNDESNHITGTHLTLFVHHTEKPIPLYLDDDAVILHLVSATYMLEEILN